MKKILFCLLAALPGLFAPGCAPKEPLPTPTAASPGYGNHPKNAFYQSQLDQYRTQHGAPGAILLVKTLQHGLWVGGSGTSNLAHQTPMRGNERIRVGSLTKPFTAAVILSLKEKGLLSLDDKLADWLPQTKGNIPRADAITLRHLLSHTSGIRNAGDDNLSFKAALLNNPADVDMTKPERILERFIYGKPLDFQPGTGYNYCNTGFMLLGMVAEKAGGKPLQILMQELIFTPLQMTDTYLEKREDDRVVRDYFDLYGNGKLLDVSEWENAYDIGGAAGGLVTTVADLLKFSEGLAGDQLSGGATLAQMRTSAQLPTCPEGDCEYGLGLASGRWRNGQPYYGHGGGIIGLDVYWYHFPEQGATVIAFLNKGVATDKSLVDRVLF
jgi:D-alanyl-D-alanine carboxypeptidase